MAVRTNSSRSYPYKGQDDFDKFNYQLWNDEEVLAPQLAEDQWRPPSFSERMRLRASRINIWPFGVYGFVFGSAMGMWSYLGGHARYGKRLGVLTAPVWGLGTAAFAVACANMEFKEFTQQRDHPYEPVIPGPRASSATKLAQ